MEFKFDSPDPRNAFSAPKHWYPRIDYLSGEAVHTDPKEFLNASVAYFQVAVDFLIQTTTEKTIRDGGKLLKAHTSGEMAALGVHLVADMDAFSDVMDVSLVGKHRNHPNLGFSIDRRFGDKAYILVPKKFIWMAQIRPIETMASVAYVFSCVRDFVNQRTYKDGENIHERASATASHYIWKDLHASREDFNTFSKWLLYKTHKYREGLDSLSPDMLYHSLPRSGGIAL
jgi:hypothetical protein